MDRSAVLNGVLTRDINNTSTTQKNSKKVSTTKNSVPGAIADSSERPRHTNYNTSIVNHTCQGSQWACGGFGFMHTSASTICHVSTQHSNVYSIPTPSLKHTKDRGINISLVHSSLYISCIGLFPISAFLLIPSFSLCLSFTFTHLLNPKDGSGTVLSMPCFSLSIE